MAEAREQVDDAVRAETRAGRAGLRIERDQFGIGGAGENPGHAVARLRRRGGRFGNRRLVGDRRPVHVVVAEAAARAGEGRGVLEAGLAGAAGDPGAGLPAPDLVARVGVQGDHGIAGGADVDEAADGLRGVLEVVGDAGAVAPDFLQLAHVAGVDLADLREAGGERRAAIATPVGDAVGGLRAEVGAGVGRAAGLDRGDSDQQDAHRLGREHPASGAPRRWVAVVGSRPGHQEPETDHDDGCEASHQPPEVEAGLEDAPGDRDREKEGEQPRRPGAAQDVEQGDDDQHPAGDGVVGAAAEADQPPARGYEIDAGGGEEGGEAGSEAADHPGPKGPDRGGQEEAAGDQVEPALGQLEERQRRPDGDTADHGPGGRHDPRPDASHPRFPRHTL